MAKAKTAETAAKEAMVVVRNVARRPIIFHTVDKTVRLGPGELLEMPKRRASSVEFKRFLRDRCVVLSELPGQEPERSESPAAEAEPDKEESKPEKRKMTRKRHSDE